MALKRVTLDDGNTLVLCPQHRDALVEHIADVGEREQGGGWKCFICTATRRLLHKPADAVVQYIDGHVVTKYPSGGFFCDCRAWLYSHLPAPQRSCRHTEQFK